MAIGKRRGGGASAPLLKYDARVGRFYTQDRVYERGEWQNVQNDVTDNLRVLFDLDNLKIGWIHFPKGAAPNCSLVPAGEEIGEAPTEDHREGLRVMALLSGESQAREVLSTALGLWNAIDRLHDDYVDGAAEHPGQLPLVTAAKFNTVKNKAGGVSVEPMFSILGWIERPAEFPPLVAKSKPATKAEEIPPWLDDPEDPGADIPA
jgi:hypothetical protein